MIAEAIPYELIGKGVVLLAVTICLLASLIVLSMGLYFIWFRGLTWISIKMWEGYDPSKGETPPVIKLRISGVVVCIRDFRITDVPSVWRRASEMSNEEHARNIFNE